jgi:hypothetical protein
MSMNWSIVKKQKGKFGSLSIMVLCIDLDRGFVLGIVFVDKVLDLLVWTDQLLGLLDDLLEVKGANALLGCD